MSDHNKSRPGVDTEAAEVSLDGDAHMVSTATDCRCLRCSRVLRKPESIDRGMGWRCAKAVA